MCFPTWHRSSKQLPDTPETTENSPRNTSTAYSQSFSLDHAAVDSLGKKIYHLEGSNVINLIISSHEVTLDRHQAGTNELNIEHIMISERVKSASSSLVR